MECEKVQKLLPRYLEDKLREGQRAKIKAHLINCPQCRRNEEKLKVSLTLVGSLEGKEKKKQKRFKWDIYPERFSGFAPGPFLKGFRNGVIMLALGLFLVWATNRLFYQPAGHDDISSIKGRESLAESKVKLSGDSELDSLFESQEKMLEKLPRLVIKKAPGRLGPPGQPEELVTLEPEIKEISFSPKAKAGKDAQSAIGAALSSADKAEIKASIRPEKGAEPAWQEIESDVSRGKPSGRQADIPVESVVREKPETIQAGSSAAAEETEPEPPGRLGPEEELVGEKVKKEPVPSHEEPGRPAWSARPGGPEEYNRGDLYKKASQKLNEKLDIKGEEK